MAGMALIKLAKASPFKLNKVVFCIHGPFNHIKWLENTDVSFQCPSNQKKPDICQRPATSITLCKYYIQN